MNVEVRSPRNLSSVKVQLSSVKVKWAIWVASCCVWSCY